jgi:hypothetical protein
MAAKGKTRSIIVRQFLNWITFTAMPKHLDLEFSIPHANHLVKKWQTLGFRSLIDFFWPAES